MSCFKLKMLFQKVEDFVYIYFPLIITVLLAILVVTSFVIWSKYGDDASNLISLFSVLISTVGILLVVFTIHSDQRNRKEDKESVARSEARNLYFHFYNTLAEAKAAVKEDVEHALNLWKSALRQSLNEKYRKAHRPDEATAEEVELLLQDCLNEGNLVEFSPILFSKNPNYTFYFETLQRILAVLESESLTAKDRKEMYDLFALNMSEDEIRYLNLWLFCKRKELDFAPNSVAAFVSGCCQFKASMEIKANPEAFALTFEAELYEAKSWKVTDFDFSW